MLLAKGSKQVDAAAGQPRGALGTRTAPAPAAAVASASHSLDSPDILSVALHLFPGPLLPQLPLQLLDLFALSLMLLLGLPHLLHIAECLWVPALLQILW